MWKCTQCGEAENEEHYKFCLSCGALKFRPAETPATERDVRTAFKLFADYSPKESYEVSVYETKTQTRRWHIPRSLSAIGHRIKDALPSAGGGSNGDLNHVKLSTRAQERVDTLVQAGVFNSKAEAASYLIDKGIEAESPLFEVVDRKLSEIERLHSELRNLVGGDGQRYDTDETKPHQKVEVKVKNARAGG
jgi:predicted  nucleic acid-binding Zn-ribbon protein